VVFGLKTNCARSNWPWSRCAAGRSARGRVIDKACEASDSRLPSSCLRRPPELAHPLTSRAHRSTDPRRDMLNRRHILRLRSVLARPKQAVAKAAMTIIKRRTAPRILCRALSLSRIANQTPRLDRRFPITPDPLCLAFSNYPGSGCSRFRCWSSSDRSAASFTKKPIFGCEASRSIESP
jgi:hypothetical protein